MDEETVNKQDKVKITEGTTAIFTEGQGLFYNPVQQFNRDLSICVLSAYSQLFQSEIKLKKSTVNETVISENVEGQIGIKLEVQKLYIRSRERQQTNCAFLIKTGLTILEALSATGLRSIRYAKEVPGIKTIIANDLSLKAVESIRENVKNNNVEHLVVPNSSDAKTLMYTSISEEKRFNVIDLDPYGSPTRFLDAAVQSICDGGLLLITATDMAVFSGSTPEACYVKYGSIPLKTKCCHEMVI